MLWSSAALLLVLTLYAWRMARQLKAEGDPAGLRSTYLAAAICGAIGTVCTVLAALI